MGLNSSKRVKEDNIPFYNDIKYDSIMMQVIKTIDSTKFIGIIKDGWTTKKLLCRIYGYKLTDDANINITYAAFNSLINECSGLFDAKIHGVDYNGLVLVTLNYLKKKKSVNYKMLLIDGVVQEKNHKMYGE